MSKLKSRLAVFWGTALVSIALVVNSVAIAQPGIVTTPSKKSSMVLFENATFSPSFAPDPKILQGISGGTEETQKQSGKATTETGICIGFIDATPDHKITLTSAFDFLKLKVSSTGDTVLLIKGPGGSWCNDDESDRNPEISGAWLAGTYEIWVGSYDAKASFPYLLQITQQK